MVAPFSALLAWVGAAACLWALCLAVRGGLRLFRSAYYPLRTHLRRYGAESGEAWAVVTGASQGIGRQFAMLLLEVGTHGS